MHVPNFFNLRYDPTLGFVKRLAGFSPITIEYNYGIAIDFKYLDCLACIYIWISTGHVG